MSKRRTDTPAVIRRESAQRIEGVRESGTTPLATYRTPMVRGRDARREGIMEALRREGLIPESESTDD